MITLTKEEAQQVLDAMECKQPFLKNALSSYGISTDEIEKMAIKTLRARLAQPAYRHGDRLLCLETDEHCIISVSGTDRQWIKFPDSHIGVYTNAQVAELFELMPKEQI